MVTYTFQPTFWEENKTQNQVLIFVKIKTQVKVLLKASDIYVTSTMSFKN